MISIYTKDWFVMEKWSKCRENISKSPDFYDKFQ
jgi:hypothetical protein